MVSYPLSPLTILIVTRCVQDSEECNNEAEDELFTWLVDHIGDYYYLLISLHGAELARILSGSANLDQQVADRVAQNPKACRRGLDDE